MYVNLKSNLRDWSLIMGRWGGATKQEGGAREVLPLQKGGGGEVLAILKGGHNKFLGTFYVVAYVLVILKEGAQKVSTL